MQAKYLNFLDKIGACEEARKWAKEQKNPKTALKNAPLEWLEFLAGKIGISLAPARAECERVTDAALAGVERVTGPAWAEYKRVTAPARAEYEKTVRNLVTWAKIEAFVNKVNP